MQDLNKKSRFLVVSRAAKLSSYHSDYLTQLCRKKQLLCKQISKVWFVDFASLDNYLRQNKKHWSLPYNEIANGNFIDIHENFSGESSIFIDDIEYVDSTKASKISSYNRDYLTQLARSGEILAKKFGKVWFFSLPSLRRHMSKLKRADRFASIDLQSVHQSNGSVTRRYVPHSTAKRTIPQQVRPSSFYSYESESDFEELPLVAGKQEATTPVSISRLNKSGRGFQIHNYIQVKKRTQFDDKKQTKIKLLIGSVDDSNVSTHQNDMAREMDTNASLSKHKSTRLLDINEAITKNEIETRKKTNNNTNIRKKQQVKVPKGVYRSISVDYNNSFNESPTRLLSKTHNNYVLKSVLLKPKCSFYLNLNIEPFIYTVSFILIFASLFMLALYNLMYYGVLSVPARIISA